MKKSRTLITAASIIVVGVIIGVVFVKTRPSAERRKPPRMTPVVECAALEQGTKQAVLDVMGTVMPAASIDLKAQVSGEIVATDENWIEGGLLKKGAAALTLEAADYSIAVRQAEADLAQAESELALEMGRQEVAKREWELLGNEEGDRDLALRVPQLKAAKARVETARARKESAELAAARTAVEAPFNALVVARHMNRGDIATPQMSLGTIVNTDVYHVKVSLPVDQLKWVELPEDGKGGSKAEVVMQDGTTREGRVIQLFADLEKQGRMARVLVEVADPLEGEGKMLLNSFVNVKIAGRQIENSHRVQRQHYREGGRVFLMTGSNTLSIVKAKPIWSDRDSVVLRFEAPNEARLITSELAVAIDGMDLRLAEEQADEASGAEKGKSGERTR